MLYFWIIALVFVVVSAVTAAWASWRAAPFLPTHQRDVERLLDLAELHPGDVVYELGAGEGRIMTAALRRQPKIKVVGFEISLFIFLLGQLRLWISGVRSKAQLRFQDFYLQSFSEASVVITFLTPEAMRKLEPKFRRELKPGTRIISAVFPLPTWSLDTKEKESGRVSLYRYRVPSDSA